MGTLLGYHAKQGTADGILQHTQNSRAGNRYWYNGRESGEIAQMGLILGHFDIPIVMVSGDRAACREAKAFLGDGLVGVEVKEGISEQSGLLLAPEAARQLVRQGAEQALADVGGCAPYKIDLPIEARLRFATKEGADAFSPKRAERVDEQTFAATFSQALEVLEF